MVAFTKLNCLYGAFLFLLVYNLCTTAFFVHRMFTIIVNEVSFSSYLPHSPFHQLPLKQTKTMFTVCKHVIDFFVFGSIIRDQLWDNYE